MRRASRPSSSVAQIVQSCNKDDGRVLGLGTNIAMDSKSDDLPSYETSRLEGIFSAPAETESVVETPGGRTTLLDLPQTLLVWLNGEG